jgi:hypothetical protein
MAMASQPYLPWATGVVDLQYEAPLADATPAAPIVTIAASFAHAGALKTVNLSVPARLSCADLKGYLAQEGIVSTLDGMLLKLQEDGPAIEDAAELELLSGQMVHLQKAAEMVSVTVLTTTQGSGQNTDEDVYELVLPGDLSGASLRDHICEATAGALQPLAVFVAKGDDPNPVALMDEEPVQLFSEMVIIVQRERQAVEQAEQAGVAHISEVMARKQLAAQGAPSGRFQQLCASNVKIKGWNVSSTSKAAWASCVVFDVPDPCFFEITVRLTQNAPPPSDSVAGRWMVGLVPLAVAEVNTEKQRQRLVGLGYWLTVCHGHPAKLRAPSMPRGICGEDLPHVPGELCKGTTVTLRWQKDGGSTYFLAQIDGGELITLPYMPAPFDDVRPCVVFGGKPAELEVLDLPPSGR